MPSRRSISLVGAAMALALAGGYVGNHMEAKRRIEDRARALTGGDPDAGRIALAQKPCGGCHQIPGVRGAKGKVGPPLTAFAGRTYIAGRLNNTPDNLTAWIIDPHVVDPKNAMPPTGVTPREARDMAAYLYTLK